jgi:hypothetical protein
MLNSIIYSSYKDYGPRYTETNVSEDHAPSTFRVNVRKVRMWTDYTVKRERPGEEH